MLKAIAISALLISNVALSSVVVVSTVGKTIDIKSLMPQGHKTKQHRAKEQTTFNIKTPGLTIGKVKTRRVNLSHLPQPFFVVGDDKSSHQWLDQYQAKLKQVHALGFLVNVSSEKAYESMANHYHITLLPLRGDSLEKTYHLSHYPVLITKHLIEQ